MNEKQIEAGKVDFEVDRRGFGWVLKITKSAGSQPFWVNSSKPDVMINFLPGNEHARDSGRILWGESIIKMKANRFPGETHMVGEKFWGLDMLGRPVVCFDEINSRIYVNAYGLTEYPEYDKCFRYNCTPNMVSFRYQGQIIMEMVPAFSVDFTCVIAGWIEPSFLDYLPYLCGLPAYQRLV